MKAFLMIVGLGLASILGVVGCAHTRDGQASSCHGGSCEAPGAGNPFQGSAPAYEPPVYAAPSPAPSMPQGSGMRSAPSYQGSGSR